MAVDVIHQVEELSNQDDKTTFLVPGNICARYNTQDAIDVLSTGETGAQKVVE